MMARPVYSDRSRRAARRPSAVSSRADWRGLVELAAACAADAESQASTGGLEMAARLHRLRALARDAQTGVFNSEAGWAAYQTANGALEIIRAFARHETPAATRAGLAPAVKVVSAWLNDVLHDMARADFERAHRGRPEVWG